MGTAEATPAELADACLNGDRRAASRLITLLESGGKVAAEASEAVARLPLPRQTIGITGPPGAGKSTLLDYLGGLLRENSTEKVAILAVDPSSPFTGGALLGDRIRMASLRNDTGVFIRSMGSRGSSGGLAAAASDALRVLAGAGYGTVLLETIGAGQAETEVINLADTVCVVQVPGYGDDVQLMKMGILEIADIFVVNKADKPEAEELKIQLEQALANSIDTTNRALRQLGKQFAAHFKGAPWTPPVLLVSALRHTGGDELLQSCRRHLGFLRQPELGPALQRNRLMREVIWRASRRLQDELAQDLAPGGKLAALLDQCVQGKMSLDRAVAQIVKNAHGGGA